MNSVVYLNNGDRLWTNTLDELPRKRWITKGHKNFPCFNFLRNVLSHYQTLYL